MTEDEKKVPIIELGIVTVAPIICNFSTSSDGENAVVRQIVEMIDRVMNKTVEQLLQATENFCQLQGITLNRMAGEEANKYLKATMHQSDGTDQLMHGVIDRNGNISTDPDRTEAVKRGQRTDN